MLILGIESTCDETAAAVVRDGVEVLGESVATQFHLHGKFRGVVPEIASRAHIENLLPTLADACASAGITPGAVDAIAVANRPGLIGSLLVGVTAAKTLAWCLGKPLVSVDHVQAHLYSVMLRGKSGEEGRGAWGEGQGERDGYCTAASPMPLAPCPSPLTPFIGLVCSGGHTALYRLRGWDDVALIGTTIDDAVGEAYDKVAAMLGLPFPGGPVIDRLAGTGNPSAYDFPRSRLGRDSLDFSFSGLKTAVKYQVFGYQGAQRTVADLSPAEVADVAASFQAACVDVLIEKVRRAVDRFGAAGVIMGGGVSANRGLRASLGRLGVPVYLPHLAYCTDNAAMIAGLGHVHLSSGRVAGLDLDAVTQSEIEALA